ncbi:hypothetical protein CCY99_07195 [Helicobacter sp. 16-1353]|uniref:AzlC family ABC transporter permease n=1 Tax=Helicobacter sp. 16-1353 TaxID=2004996 RepID=UPI000DCF36CA|nr:AzlC family ABC transporter permease [Helicobacter sp. 16-1353]RAX52744.1 hypothetical protein CCY99_07195 [Helicobacter sp. 16-1353]
MNPYIFTLKDAFLKDLEIMFGYISMGAIFGILLKASGFGTFYAAIMSIFIYSGIGQFLAISFFSGGFGLINIFITILMVNARQSFYTLIMMPEYKHMDWKRFLHIFWLTDETFALLKTKIPHKDSNKDLFMLFISMLNYIYWIVGCILGVLIGGILTFNTDGLDFIMTAIFVVIFIDLWKSSKTHIPAILGIIISLFWLITIGEQYFLIVSIITSIIVFIILRPFLNAKIQIRES